MTDFIGSLLHKMSAQFNSSATTEDLDKNIKTDSTLKWKNLHQNQYAAKNASINKPKTGSLEEGEQETKPEVNNQEVDPTKIEETDDQTVVAEEVVPKNVEPEIEQIVAPVLSPVIAVETKETTKVEEKTSDEKTPEEKKPSKSKVPKTPTITKSDRSLRSKATENETNEKPSESLPITAEDQKLAPTNTPPTQSDGKEAVAEDEADSRPKRNRKRKGDDPPLETVPPDTAEKKRGRQRKETPKPPDEVIKTEEVEPSLRKSEPDFNAEKPRLIITIRKDKSTPPEPDTSSTTESKSPRKRGRKPKVEMSPKNGPSPTKKSPRLSRDGSESILASAIARKEKQNDGPPTRLSRRIKPTAKILASEELRQEFEYQHLSRLHASEEHLESLGKQAVVPKPEMADEPEVSVVEIKPKPDEMPGTLEDQIPISIIPNHQAVSKFITSTPSTSTFAAPAPVQKSCPEPEQFLHDIKNSKLNFHRSPEDNKKLNKKQQKRLSKLKERHFIMLGLRKTPKGSTGEGKPRADHTASEESESDDNEEFVPSKKVVAPGRPNVTLRSLRQQKHTQLLPSVEKEKPVDIPLRGRRPQRDKPSSEKVLPIVTSIHNFPSPSTSGITRISNKTSQSSSSSLSLTPSSPNQRTDNFLCTCAELSKYFVRHTDATSYCVAIDEIDGQKIGCSNEMVGELLNLRRPSVKASYMILCRSHEKRLLAHNCCAGCGVFLTKGVFMLCSNKHFFHRNCATKFIYNAPYDPNSRDFLVPQLVLKCPHCGTDAPVSEISITFKCGGKAPVFSPNREVVKPAKMGSSNYNHMRNSSKPSPFINIEKLVPHNILEILQQATVRLKSQAPKVFDARDFFYAIRNGEDVHRLAEIIVSGFDVTTPLKEFHNETCLHLISNFGSLTMAYMCLSRMPSTNYLNFMDNELRTAVMCAVVGGKNDILQLLIFAGADPTIKGPDGMTALHLAAKIGNFAATQIMLEFYRQSVAINKLALFINSLDDGRWSALVWAAENGHTEIVTYLLGLDADVTLCDTENNTVLHWAVLSGKLETLLPLLRKNVNIDGQNINGDTALHIACRQGNTQLCVLLLANGASINIKNISNEMPMNCILDLTSECYRVLQLNSKLGGLGVIREKKIYCHDISNGREQHPIQIVGASANGRRNDDGPLILPDFKYITKNILLQNNIQIDYRISQMRVCTCSDNCIAESCQCGQISIQNWYTLEGRLIDDFNYQDPPMIFECNDVCCCSKLLCKNRIVQNGTRLHFQVFECDVKRKGLGVRCLTKITKGSFVAEYTGEILTDVEADRRTDDSYFFDLGASEHCIDANLYGNMSRFFNHSCNSNIVPIRVYYEHQDLRFPKIAFFANRDIEVGEEIAFDYGEKFWMVKHKSFTCSCGQPNCRYSSDTITKTLDDYNQRNRGSQHCV